MKGVFFLFSYIEKYRLWLSLKSILQFKGLKMKYLKLAILIKKLNNVNF